MVSVNKPVYIFLDGYVKDVEFSENVEPKETIISLLQQLIISEKLRDHIKLSNEDGQVADYSIVLNSNTVFVTGTFIGEGNQGWASELEMLFNSAKWKRCIDNRSLGPLQYFFEKYHKDIESLKCDLKEVWENLKVKDTEIENLKCESIRQRDEIENMKNLIEFYKSKDMCCDLKKRFEEISKVREIFNSSSSQNSLINYLPMGDEGKKDIDKLSNDLKEGGQFVCIRNDFDKEMANFQATLIELSQINHGLESDFNNLDKEKQLLVEELKTKHSEIETLCKKNLESANEKNVLEAKIDTMNKEIKNLTDQIEVITHQISKKQEVLKKEKEDILNQYEEKQKELEKLKLTLENTCILKKQESPIEDKRIGMKIDEAKKQLEQRIRNMKFELEKNCLDNETIKNENGKLKGQITLLLRKISSLSTSTKPTKENEKSFLNNSILETSKENDELKRRIKSREDEVKQYIRKNDELTTEKIVNKSKIFELNNEIIKLNEFRVSANKEIQDFKQQINKIKNENIDLKSELSKEIKMKESYKVPLIELASKIRSMFTEFNINPKFTIINNNYEDLISVLDLIYIFIKPMINKSSYQGPQLGEEMLFIRYSNAKYMLAVTEYDGRRIFLITKYDKNNHENDKFLIFKSRVLVRPKKFVDNPNNKKIIKELNFHPNDTIYWVEVGDLIPMNVEAKYWFKDEDQEKKYLYLRELFRNANIEIKTNSNLFPGSSSFNQSFKNSMFKQSMNTVNDEGDEEEKSMQKNH